MPVFTVPTVAQFQNYFVRDFPYGSDINTSVTPNDIQNGINDALTFVNQEFFADQNSFNVGFLNLAAHFMVTSLRSSSQGIRGQYNFLQQSKGVGPASESFAIPQRILDDPTLSMLTKTNYGAKYLFLVLPCLSGAMWGIPHKTTP